MTDSRINKVVTRPVVLDGHRYGGTLTITGTGAIEPTAPGRDAIDARAGVVNARIVNHGTLIGGASVDMTGYQAGTGIFFVNAGFVGNDGTIEGGAGGRDGAGGIGIDLQAGGMVANTGSIAGGTGYGYYDRGGGAGIYFGGRGVMTNSGTIDGAAGTGRGTGGVGVDLSAGGTVVNHGLIHGGTGATDGYYGQNAGAGVVLGGASVITNSGTIIGGDGGGGLGGDTVGFGGNGVTGTTGTLVNQGLIKGGYGYTYGFRHGGAGVDFSAAATVSNAGTIRGGDGTGTGVVLAQGGALNNAGTIDGAHGSSLGLSAASAGGSGVIFDGGGVLATSGVILGGNGGGSHYGAGPGGAGVDMDGPAELLNHGTITGGDGIGDLMPIQKYPNAGGDGVMLAGGATLHNAGTIAGGSIIVYGHYDVGNGGVGVSIDGGTLITTGTIEGGAPGANGPGVQGAAVAFGSVAGTLEVAPSAIFSGDITANTSVDDVLVLAGSAAGTLAGFGTSVTGFTTIVENSQAHWTLAGTIENPGHGQGAISLGSSASLTLTGAVQIGTIAFGAGDALTLGAPTQVSSVLSGFGSGDTIDLSGIQAGSLSYAGGTLTLYGPDQHVVDTLSFSGKYSAQDFGLKPDGTGGTTITFTGQDTARDSGFAHVQVGPVAHEGAVAFAPWHSAPPDGFM